MKKYSLLLALSITLFNSHTAADSLALNEVPDLQPDTYRAVRPVEPENLETFYSNIQYTTLITSKLSARLVKLDDTQSLQAQLAKRWKRSVDGKTYTFYLRKNAKFHNGTPVTAKDVIATFTKLLDPNIHSTIATNFLARIDGSDDFQAGKTKFIKGLKALDDYTIEITLKQVDDAFLNILASYNNFSILSSEYINNIKKQDAYYSISSFMAGPYTLESWKRNQSITLQFFDDYFDKYKYISRIEFWYPNHPALKENTIESLFLAGKMDELELSEKTTLVNKEIEKFPNKFNIIKRSTLKLSFIGMDTRKPPFNNKLVRQAINYALDRSLSEITTQNMSFREARYNTLLPRLHSDNENSRFYEYSPKSAKTLLQQAGYKEKLSDFPILRIGGIQHHAEKIFVQQQLKESLERIGIQLEIINYPDWISFEKAFKSGKLHLAPFSWQLYYPNMDNLYFEVFHSKGSFNYSNFQNDVVLNKMIEQAKQEPNRLKKSLMHKEIDRRIMEDPYIIPNFTETTHIAFNKRVKVRELRIGNGDSLFDLPSKGMMLLP